MARQYNLSAPTLNVLLSLLSRPHQSSPFNTSYSTVIAATRLDSSYATILAPSVSPPPSHYRPSSAHLCRPRRSSNPTSPPSFATPTPSSTRSTLHVLPIPLCSPSTRVESSLWRRRPAVRRGDSRLRLHAPSAHHHSRRIIAPTHGQYAPCSMTAPHCHHTLALYHCGTHYHTPITHGESLTSRGLSAHDTHIH